LPPHCLATGVIDRRVGAGGKSYGIEFAVALPDEWNGRFLYQGGGGLNGTLYPPIGGQAIGHTLALARGFAVASTDGGHKGAVFDGAFFEDQQATLDFLYRANDVVTVAAKAIVAAYYGKPAAHSYWVGCSTGGREGMLMSQRYPQYYDGIVAGAPAMHTTYSGIGDRWAAVALNAIAPRDDKGNPAPSRAFSPAQKKRIASALLEACDANDGARDGMIFDVRGCRFDPATLVCKGPATDTCLSAEQAATITKAMAGPKRSTGVPVYPGFYYDSGVLVEGVVPGILSGPSPLFPESATTMDVDQEAERAATPFAAVGDTANWTNLNAFSARGGKLLFFHGVSDPWFSAEDTVRYFDGVVRDNGGAEAVSKWSRLFLVPGMGHCSGGDATLDHFDMLDSLVNWVEKGTPPDRIVADGPALPGRTRPLCPWPKHAQYRGSGDIENAENFDCRE
jgi:feruloyl esterase